MGHRSVVGRAGGWLGHGQADTAWRKQAILKGIRHPDASRLVRFLNRLRLGSETDTESWARMLTKVELQ